MAVLAGLVWALAFPPVSAAGMGWVAPLLLALPGLAVSGGRAFRLGWLAGWVHHLATLVWLLWNPFPAGAAAGWVALSAFLALYPATWAWLLRRWLPGGRAEGENAPPGWRRLAEGGGARRAAWALAGAAAWVALEMAQARVLTGFPWNFLGVSQVADLPLIQVASWTGVYGVSFVMVWLSLALLGGGVTAGVRLQGAKPAVRRLAGPGGLAAREVLPAALAVGALWLWGGRELLDAGAGGGGRKLRVALVQPSIPQRLIFDPAEATRRFEQLLELTDLALAADPDLLVWPEAALPSLSREQYAKLVTRIRSGRAWMILGGDDVRPNPEHPDRVDWFNAAFLLSPRSGLKAVYHKQRLVIFGEYVPLQEWLPWLGWLTPVTASFRAGRGPVPFRLTPFGVTTSVLICFEDTFARLARRHATADTDFLLNLTNDAWFGETAAQWQHLAAATFRAVENRLPLVRCANNGISGWVTAHGAWRNLAFGPGTRVYDRGFKIIEVPLGPSPRPLTFYTRHGDVFGWTCVAVSVVLLGGIRPRRPRGRPENDAPGETAPASA